MLPLVHFFIWSGVALMGVSGLPSGARGETGLPEVTIPLPGDDHSAGPAYDTGLKTTFPGQFFGSSEVRVINRQEQAARKRRELDKDMCCVTEVWFGNAHEELTDVDSHTWTVVQGVDTHQAYSRGECHSSNPQRTVCPEGGKCVQHYRLHTLWVRDGRKAKLKYFRIPSHCAYEPEAR